MNLNLDNFLQTLFPNGGLVCYTDQPHGYRAHDQPLDRDIFFSVNSLLPIDKQPTKPWHAVNTARRADCNVAEYRNFLLELDNMPLKDQVPYVSNLLPYTSCTYSGGKSHHFIISLQEPIKTSEAYSQLARRLHKRVPAADPTTKNPSRLSRLPFRMRPETGKEQALVYLGDRISFSELDALLPRLPVYAPKTTEQIKVMVTPILLKAAHAPDSIMQEFNLGGRNQFMYWVHMRCLELGLDEAAKTFFVTTAYNNLRDKNGFSWNEACLAARIKS